MPRMAGIRRAKWMGGVIVLIAIAMAPGAALAVTPPDADAPQARIGFETSWYLYARPHHQPQSFSALLRGGDVPTPSSRFRRPKIRLLHYSAPLRFGESDLIFKFRAPGKKRSIATIEFLF